MVFESSVNMSDAAAFFKEFTGKGRTGFKKRKAEGNSTLFYEKMGRFVCIAYMKQNEESLKKDPEDH